MPIVFFVLRGEGDYLAAGDVSYVGVLFFGVFGAVVFYGFFDFFELADVVETAIFFKPFGIAYGFHAGGFFGVAFFYEGADFFFKAGFKHQVYALADSFIKLISWRLEDKELKIKFTAQMALTFCLKI